MNEEELRFDPTIKETSAQSYIEIKKNGRVERFIFTRAIKQTQFVAGRATTC
jgi:hypothetical protein